MVKIAPKPIRVRSFTSQHSSFFVQSPSFIIQRSSFNALYPLLFRWELFTLPLGTFHPSGRNPSAFRCSFHSSPSFFLLDGIQIVTLREGFSDILAGKELLARLSLIGVREMNPNKTIHQLNNL